MTLIGQIQSVSQSLRDGRPKLLVVVDTEEEFDWVKPHSRAATSVGHVRYLNRTQDIFERYHVLPTYVVDYPVASQEIGYVPLRDWASEGKCQIGAHLHPWVNPPFEEEVSARNSYPGNLPAPLERGKLRRLTETITANFGQRPVIYRAGRYGIGPSSGTILEELGYEVDTSVVPFTNFESDGGPNFSAFGTAPFWFGPTQRVLEVPLTVAWYGCLRSLGKRLQLSLMSRVGLRLHLPGLLARLGWLERIRLTPEGASFAELKRLTDTLIVAGERLFVFSYHSPSVVPGNTPYVRSDSELQAFLRLIEEYCDYFFSVCGGIPGTLSEVRDSWNKSGDGNSPVVE